MSTPTLPTLLEHWARVQPEAVAVTDGSATLTWRELNAEANRLAQLLAECGIGAGDVVALRLQNTARWVVMLLAVSKLQAVLLGINWRLVPEEANFMLENAGAKLLVLDDTEPQLLAAGITALPQSSILPAADFFERQPTHTAPERVMPELAQQIIFTSGTTGRPKGVMLQQRPDPANPRLNRYLADMAGAYRHYTPEDVVLVSMPMHHGSGPSQVKSAMKGGSKVVMQQRFDAADWFALVTQHGVTHWTGVPTMYKRLKTHQEQSGQPAPRTLKSMGIGAAPVPMAIKQWVADQFGAVLHEGYGSTETGMITRMAPEDHFKKAGSSGKPYEGAVIEIRAEDGALLATDEVGEIWVNTPVAITHYLNAPPLDADTRDAKGFFRTGDMGRIDADSYLFITDRAKDMIISGGVNIYPAEIESAFYQHPQLQDIAVIGLPDEEFGEQVVAYYESKSSQPIAEGELLALSAASLASYKRPKSFVHVAELPRNAVGKILKRELRQPHWNQQERNV